MTNVEPAFQAEVTVRSYELDSYGHVNHANYLNYLEYARQLSLEEKGLTFTGLAAQGMLMFIASLTIDYRSPATLGNILQISTQYELSGERSFLAHQTIHIGQRVVVEARMTIVTVDRKGTPIPVPRLVRDTFMKAATPE